MNLTRWFRALAPGPTYLFATRKPQVQDSYNHSAVLLGEYACSSPPVVTADILLQRSPGPEKYRHLKAAVGSRCICKEAFILIDGIQAPE